MKFFRRKKKEEDRNYTQSQMDWAFTAANTVRLNHTQILEAAALLWSSALSASVPSSHEDILTPEILSEIGWSLIFRGEAVYWWNSEKLFLASDYDIKGSYDQYSWTYDLTLSGPSTTHKVSAKSDRVFHIRWRKNPHSKMAIAPAAELSRRIDELISRELNSAHGFLLPVPKSPTDAQHSILKTELKNLKGRHMMVETQMAGHDAGDVRSGKWRQERIGADFPMCLIDLRAQLVKEAGLITGVGTDLLQESPGTSKREGMRLFAGTVVSSMLRQISAEAERVLGGKLEFSLGKLWASDYVGRVNSASTLMSIYNETGDEFWREKAKLAVSV